jgi:hypothetical protein
MSQQQKQASDAHLAAPHSTVASRSSEEASLPVAGAVSTELERSRADHLAWCKKRALEYVDHGDVQGAFASMASDLNKHPKTAGHVGIEMGLMQLMFGMLSSPYEMRRFIEGFN